MSSVLRSVPGKVLEWIVARRGHNNFFSRSSRQEVRSFLCGAVHAAARVGRVDMLEILVILAETCCEGEGDACIARHWNKRVDLDNWLLLSGDTQSSKAIKGIIAIKSLGCRQEFWTT